MSNKTSCFTSMILGIAFFLFVTSAFANRSNFVKYDTTGKEGIIIQNNKFSKKFSILMIDTTLSGNRFDYSWHIGPDSNGFVSPNNHLLPAYLVDSALAASCDSLLRIDPNNKKIQLTSYPRKKLLTLTKTNIRLYAGYVDNVGKKNIVVQFISSKEFKRSRHIYLKELFLVVPAKELHFAVIKM